MAPMRCANGTGRKKVRSGPLALLLGLQYLYAQASYVNITWILAKQAALASHDQVLREITSSAEADTDQQLTWMITRMKQAAPQALLVAD